MSSRVKVSDSAAPTANMGAIIATYGQEAPLSPPIIQKTTVAICSRANTIRNEVRAASVYETATPASSSDAVSSRPRHDASRVTSTIVSDAPTNAARGTKPYLSEVACAVNVSAMTAPSPAPLEIPRM